jgi:hypothetical protein
MTPDILYLDNDTEITEAIEKLKAAKGQEVRVVAPARSGLMQSAVNLKLLKTAAHDSNKDLVLVTTDKAATGLAGMLGLMVARNVKADAAVPEADAAPVHPSHEPTVIDDSKPTKSKPSDADDLPIKSNLPKDRVVTDGDKPQKAKSPKVPNFGGLNKKMAWVAIGIGALLVFVLTYIFLPTATINVQANAKKLPLNFRFTADASTTKSDYGAGIVAAQKLENTKDTQVSFTATGQKDVGNKATGTVTVKNCDDTSTHNLAAGSTMTASGKAFTTNSSVTIPAGTAGGGVVNCSSGVDVGITASQNGDSYNLNGATFAISGFSNLYKATGSTSGGSSKVVTVVSGDDVKKATQQAQGQLGSNMKQDLINKAGDQYYVFEDSFKSDTVSATPSVAEGSEATSNVTLTLKVKNTAFAVLKKELNALFEAQAKKQLSSDQQIYQSGYEDAKYSNFKQNGDTMQIQADTTTYYGDQIDTAAIARESAGKPKKAVSDIAKTKSEQVTGATVDSTPALMPFTPLLSSRIKVKIDVSTSQ